MLTLEQSIDLFLQRDLAPETIRTHKRVLKTFQDMLGVKLPVSAITVYDINRWIQSLRARKKKYADHPRRPTETGHLADETIRKNLKTVRSLFNWLIEIEVLTQNPAQKVKLRRSSALKPASKAVSPEELQAIKNVAAAKYIIGKPKHLAIFMFLVDTGVRAGEAATLTVKQLDIQKRRALVLVLSHDGYDA